MIITFSHPKGGVGKTMLAFNYAVYCQNKGEAVTIADLDGQHSITNFGKIRDLDGGLSKLDILKFEKVEDFIAFLQNSDSRKIIIDTGGFDSSFNRIALAFANMVITPVSDSPVEVMRLLDFDRILGEISRDVNHQILTHIVLNRIHPSLRNMEHVIEPLKDKHNFILLDSIVRDRTRFKFSVGKGRSVYEEDEGVRDDKAVKELNDLFKEIDSIINERINNEK